MPATIKRSLKPWVLVYVGFILALTTANVAPDAMTGPALVSPGSMATDVFVDRSYFRTTIERSPRNDI
jgi:hypothetical protein